MPLGYSVRKAAQVVAFLVIEQGGSADMIKTVKLAYLADRKFIELYDMPILNDDFYCLENGPVGSTTYDYIKGRGSQRSEWEKYIKPLVGYNIKLASRSSSMVLDELSEAEEDVLRDIVKEYRKLRPFELVDHIHQTCREWTDPGKSSDFLPYKKVFEAVGKKNCAQLNRHVVELRKLASVLQLEP